MNTITIRLSQKIRSLHMAIRKPFGDVSAAETLRISLCDLNEGVVDAWLDAFGDVDAVEVVQDDIFKLRCDAIVSPANSFGDMDGGIDKVIDDAFGHRAQSCVKAAIGDQFFGELPVGMALITETGDRRFPFLISAPTMRVPTNITHTINAYHAMRALLTAIHQHNQSDNRPIRSVAIPGLGAGVGRMSYDESARQMRTAYNSIIGGEWQRVVYSALAPYVMRD